MFLEWPFIGHFYWSKGDFPPLDRPGLLKVERIDCMHLLSERAFRAKQAKIFGLVKQHIAKVGMGDGDQGNGPLLNRLSKQIHRAVLGHHVLHLTARHHHGTLVQHWHDPTFLVAVSGGGEHQDRFAALGHGGATKEIYDSGNPGEIVVGQGIGGHLAGQIDLLADIHGHHFVVLGNDPGVIDIFGRVEFHRRIVVQKVVEILGADGIGTDDLTFVESFSPVGDHSHGHQFHDGVGDILGVDPQVILLHQSGYIGIRGGTQRHLHG